MNWFKISEKIDADFNNNIKNILKNDPFVQNIFKLYDVPMETMENGLVFIKSKLGKKYAKSNGKEIHINELIANNEEFLKTGIHFIIHELCHWLTRQREKDGYLLDPEEGEAFTLGISWEIKNGKSMEEIASVYLPILSSHFKNKVNAKSLFKRFYENALKIADKLK